MLIGLFDRLRFPLFATGDKLTNPQVPVPPEITSRQSRNDFASLFHRKKIKRLDSASSLKINNTPQQLD